MVPLDTNAYHASSGHLVVEQGTVSGTEHMAPTLHTSTPLVYGSRARVWLGLLSYDEGANKYRTSVSIDGVWHRRDLALLLTATSTVCGIAFDADALGLPNPVPFEGHENALHTLDTLRWDTLHADASSPTPGVPMWADLAWEDLAPRWMEALAQTA